MIMKKGKFNDIFPMLISVKLPFFAFSLVPSKKKYFCYKFIFILIPFDELLDEKNEREYFFRESTTFNIELLTL